MIEYPIVTSNNNGDAAEHRFLSDALFKGLLPLSPEWSGSRCDVFLHHPSTMVRVQVKFGFEETFKKDSDATRLVMSLASSHTDKNGKTIKTRYTKNDIDLFAGFSPLLRHWYIIPFEAITQTGTKLIIETVPGKPSKFARRFIENWDAIFRLMGFDNENSGNGCSGIHRQRHCANNASNNRAPNSGVCTAYKRIQTPKKTLEFAGNRRCNE